MKTTTTNTLRLLAVSLLAGTLSASAQFNSGSTGANGALFVTNEMTLQLPDSGTLNYTTITVETNGTLRFLRNPKNTPVHLLATGNVNIRGTIDLSGGDAPSGLPRQGGKGGPGGFDGGYPGFGDNAPGNGYGPGGGKGGLNNQGDCWGRTGSAGAGSYSTTASTHYPSVNKGAVYGSQLLVPLVGGSGGGGTAGFPGIGGGGGGGALLIASNTKIDLSGTIRTDGGRGESLCGPPATHINPGSGGAVRLVAPSVAGSGTISAAAGLRGDGSYGGYGRTRVDCIDRRYLNINASQSAYSVGNYMVTFPTSRLDIRHVAGMDIPEGSGPVSFTLTNGSPTNVTVTVQARNFNAFVPVQVAVTPENGPRTIYTNTIDNASATTATNHFTIGLPVSTPVTIEAWTRVP